MSAFREAVLLVDADTFRPVILRQLGIVVISERVHIGLGVTAARTWECSQDERALSGQRIFREHLPPLPKEPDENPIFDEDGHRKPIKIPLTPFDS